MSDPRLEARLADLATHLDLPPAPDVAGRVRARLEAGKAAPRARRLRRALAVPLAAVVVALAGLAVSPPARSTVLRWLGLEGVKIERLPQAPKSPTASRPRSGLGEPTTL